jgi:lambda repressor-like predicted transcriptional regulator
LAKSKIDIKEILAANLKENLRKKGLTQEKLSEQADMSLQYLAMLELARKFPSGEMLERLANALDIEPHQLFSVATTPRRSLGTFTPGNCYRYKAGNNRNEAGCAGSYRRNPRR